MINKAMLFIGLSVAVTLTSVVKADTIFSCETANNKKIEVKDLGSHIEYRFGRHLENPELVLSVLREQASTWQWNGVGREMGYSVTIPNGKINYIVFVSMERFTEEHSTSSGVIIEDNQQLVTTVDCLTDTLTQSLEGIDLKESN